MYIQKLNKFYDEEVISSYECNSTIIKLMEIKNSYFIVYQKDNVVKKVSNFNDLGISLSVYHSYIENETLANLH